jgi:hypothetical protein
VKKWIEAAEGVVVGMLGIAGVLMCLALYAAVLGSIGAVAYIVFKWLVGA